MNEHIIRADDLFEKLLKHAGHRIVIMQRKITEYPYEHTIEFTEIVDLRCDSCEVSVLKVARNETGEVQQ